jgi:hypothetical protein
MMRRHGYKSISVQAGTPGFPNPDEHVNAFLAEVTQSQSGEIVSMQTVVLTAQMMTSAVVVAIHYTYDDDDATVSTASHRSR